MDDIFVIVWGIGAIVLLSSFYILGRKELKALGYNDSLEFEFKEKHVSAFYKKKGFGGSKNATRVSVTKNEIWLTTNVFFAWIAKREKLLRNIPLSQIKEVESNGKFINLVLYSGSGDDEVICLEIKNVSGFLSSLNLEQVKYLGFDLKNGNYLKKESKDKKEKTPPVLIIIALILSTLGVTLIWYAENKDTIYNAFLIYYQIIFYGVVVNAFFFAFTFSIVKIIWKKQI